MYVVYGRVVWFLANGRQGAGCRVAKRMHGGSREYEVSVGRAGGRSAKAGA